MSFTRGQITKPEDTEVSFFQDGIPQDPEDVVFTVFDLTTGETIILGVPNQKATRLETGRFYARFLIPEDATFGDYRLDYSFALRALDGSLITQKIEQPFVVDPLVLQPTDPKSKDLISRLRIRLRDNNPDAYYRFAPPIRTGIISGFTRLRGFIWQDDELESFLKDSVSELRSFWFGQGVNDFPNVQEKYIAIVLYVAAYHALMTEGTRWISEEFSYDIDGVSLSIDRSQKFMSMAESFRQAAMAALEGLSKNVRSTKGIKAQFGVSRGSALGPRVSGAPVLNFTIGRRGAGR